MAEINSAWVSYEPSTSQPYTDMLAVTADWHEVSALCQAAFNDARLTPSYLATTSERLQREDLSAMHVQVRTAHGDLVGHGSLWYQGPIGMLTTFAVHPDHQNRGIGHTIIDEQLRFAELLGLSGIFTELEPTNTLVHYYLRRGFQEEPTLSDLRRFVKGRIL